MPTAIAAASSGVPKIASRCCQASSRAAAEIAGSESKNEKRAAVARSRPVNTPDTIVTPLRDVPGISASTCARPMVSPSRKVTASTPSRPGWPSRARRRTTSSATAITTASTTSMAVTSSICRASPRTRSRRVKPTSTIGSVPNTTSQATRLWGVPNGFRVASPWKNPRMRAATSRRRATNTASNVPV